MSLSRSSVLALLIGLGATAGAQQKAPDHWVVIPDGRRTYTNSTTASDSTLWFVAMAPGWHVTMGPGGVLYDPRRFADGRFDAEFEFHLFPKSANNQAGLFLGGTQTNGAVDRYTAFVIRADGAAAVVRREGDREILLHPWTPVAAIARPTDKDTGRNTLRVAMDSAGVHFSVNGTPVRSWKHGELQLIGAYGIRMGRDVNVHVTRLDVLQRLAPIPAGK